MGILRIFGPYPPPLGGISVHIKRIEPFLKEKQIKYRIYNHGSFSGQNVIATNKNPLWYLRLLFLPDNGSFHFHQFFYFHYIFCYLFSIFRKNKTLITIHSERLLGYNGIKQRIALFFLKRTKQMILISVSKNLNDFLLGKGINSKYLPAYVPPRTENKVVLEENNGLFLFSVWKFNNNLANEIYNVPLAFKFLSDNKQGLKMLFMIGDRKNSDLRYLNELIELYGIEEKIQLIFNKNLVDYVQNCKFLLRPNLSDGYGVSIQEAMDMGVPAIASHVCERPKGSVLFDPKNLEDLNEKVRYVLTMPKEEVIREHKKLTYHKELIEIYINALK